MLTRNISGNRKKFISSYHFGCFLQMPGTILGALHTLYNSSSHHSLRIISPFCNGETKVERQVK